MNYDEKPEKKILKEDIGFHDNEENTDLLEGKTLHDLYRHTTKMIK